MTINKTEAILRNIETIENCSLDHNLLAFDGESFRSLNFFGKTLRWIQSLFIGQERAFSDCKCINVAEGIGKLIEKYRLCEEYKKVTHDKIIEKLRQLSNKARPLNQPRINQLIEEHSYKLSFSPIFSTDTLHNIASFLPLPEVQKVRRVSTQFKEAAETVVDQNSLHIIREIAPHFIKATECGEGRKTGHWARINLDANGRLVSFEAHDMTQVDFLKKEDIDTHIYSFEMKIRADCWINDRTKKAFEVYPVQIPSYGVTLGLKRLTVLAKKIEEILNQKAEQAFQRAQKKDETAKGFYAKRAWFTELVDQEKRAAKSEA